MGVYMSSILNNTYIYMYKYIYIQISVVIEGARKCLARQIIALVSSRLSTWVLRGASARHHTSLSIYIYIYIYIYIIYIHIYAYMYALVCDFLQSFLQSLGLDLGPSHSGLWVMVRVQPS